LELNIVHTTRYNYSKAVSLLPHYIRLKPQSRSYLTLSKFDISISPEPMSISERIDAENNPYFQVWMQPVPLKELEIKAQINLQLETFDPFHFIIDPPVRFFQSKFHYPDTHKEYLKPFLPTKVCSKNFTSFLSERIKGSDRSCILFITDLLRYIANNFEYIRKERDVTLESENTFNKLSGSCKELSWMLIEMLRCTGLAARFVSGYAYNPILGDGHELHAWVEVLLPGAGWIGLDPSSGLLTDEHYIPVATSFNPELTMPVTGAFAGDAKSKLNASVTIIEVD
tara:strand:+ start:23825 stop:24676 length:852 start_codon:yes stop_codon:yes gene_type:complete